VQIIELTHTYIPLKTPHLELATFSVFII